MSETRIMFICAKWKKLSDGCVARCDKDQHHTGIHVDSVIAISWHDPTPAAQPERKWKSWELGESENKRPEPVSAEATKPPYPFDEIVDDGAAVQFDMDGDKWCAHRLPFTNMMEMPCGFGDTPMQALANLIFNEGVELMAQSNAPVAPPVAHQIQLTDSDHNAEDCPFCAESRLKVEAEGAREFRMKWSHKPTPIPPNASGLWYSEECTDQLMTEFAGVRLLELRTAAQKVVNFWGKSGGYLDELAKLLAKGE